LDGGSFRILGHILEGRSLKEFPVAALVPRSAGIDFTVLTLPSGIVEELIDQAGGRSNTADRKCRLSHTLQSRGESSHVRDLAGHQELEGVLGAGVATEVDEALVDDLGAGFGSNVTS
jgi:hypothetical protein